MKANEAVEFVYKILESKDIPLWWAKPLGEVIAILEREQSIEAENDTLKQFTTVKDVLKLRAENKKLKSYEGMWEELREQTIDDEFYDSLGCLNNYMDDLEQQYLVNEKGENNGKGINNQDTDKQHE